MANNIEKIMEEFRAAWNSRDVDKIVPFYTDDCVLEDMGLGVVCHGKKELQDFIRQWYVDYPDLRFEWKSRFNAGNWVAGEWTMKGTHVHSSNPAIPATGKRFSVRGASIIEVQGGKINRETDYYNMITVMQ